MMVCILCPSITCDEHCGSPIGRVDGIGVPSMGTDINIIVLRWRVAEIMREDTTTVTF